MNTSEVAIRAIRAGGELALSYFNNREQLTIDCKGPQDYVSEADRAVEAKIVEILADAFPNDGFLGEEGAVSRAPREWVIDPIDGTTNFVRGLPYFCSTLALVEDDVLVAGWIFDPIHNNLYAAARGQGATLNGQPLRSAWRARFSEGLVGICHSSKLTAGELSGRINAALEAGAIMRQPGAGALILCDLAQGRLDAVFDQHLKPWDALAGLLIAKEAGAVVSDYLASPNWRTEPQPTLAAGPEIYQEMLEVWPETRDVTLLETDR